MSDVIPIRPEAPQQPSQPEDKNSLSETPAGDPYIRSLIPPNTPTQGRSIKFRDVFSTSGAVAADADVVSVTSATHGTTETDLKSFILFANEWHEGMVIRITARGKYTTVNGTATFTVRVGESDAPTTQWDAFTTSAAQVTNADWSMEWIGIVKELGTSGDLQTSINATANAVNKDDIAAAIVAINTTIAQTIALTAQCNDATSGSSFSVRQWIVEILY